MSKEYSQETELDYYAIGQRIRRYRKACGLSQEQLAEIVDISTTHLSHIETGNTKLSLPVFIKIASALSVQTDDLLSDFPKETRSTYQNMIQSSLEGCSMVELKILYDIINSSASAMHKYL